MKLKIAKNLIVFTVLVSILFIILWGVVQEPKRHIKISCQGNIINENAMIERVTSLEFLGVYNEKLDQFNGSIVIDTLELKNIVAKNNGVFFTLKDEDGSDKIYGSIYFSNEFDTFEILITDKEIIGIILGNSFEKEYIRIIDSKD